MGSHVPHTRPDAPVKPGLPPLLIGALMFWAACAAVYAVCCGHQLNDLVSAVPFAGSFLVLAGMLCVPRRLRWVGAAGVALALGALFGLFGAALLMTETQAATSPGTWQLTLTSDPTSGEYGASAFADARSDDGRCAHLGIRFDGDTDLLRGDIIRLAGTPRAVGAQQASFYWSQGSGAILSVRTFEKVSPTGLFAPIAQMRRTALAVLAENGGDQAGLLQALACGYRPTIAASGSYESFKTCGLAHMVAVSGAHLALVVGMLGLLLQAFGTPRRIALCITISFVVAYLVFAGIPLSAVRAACMVVLALTASLAQRRSASINALALCIIGFIACDPVVSVSASFVLSAGSTLGILLFANLIASWFSSDRRAIHQGVSLPLGMTFASNIATLPYSAALFSQVPLIAPVANVVAVPLFAVACSASLLCALFACIAPPLSGIVVMLGRVAVWPLAYVVDLMAQIPYACIALSADPAFMVGLSVLVGIALWMGWPMPSRRVVGGSAGALAVIVAALLAFLPLTVTDQLVMLDVGQGDAFLVRSQGRAVLIDTGNKDALLRENLGRLGVSRLDAVIISHHDDDHCGSLSTLAGFVQIGAVYVAAPALGCSCDGCADLRRMAEHATGASVQGLAVGDTLQVGRFALCAVWPDAFADEGGNADSLCLLAQIDCDEDGSYDWRTAFMGDAESEQMQRMVDAGRLGSVDVLKVGHHGSKVSLSEALIEKLSPHIALISCGVNNRYGHPTPEALACLDEVEQVLRTDQVGTVVLDFAREGIYVRTS
ncbi:DNA internalization-related competence protein ComEC/Rec2 [Adlercreutzia murintestinalis]|uniref:DNA internalization-related competence protein ComEC/Rec2 n=1 Tax=Adlercreutzia murintestinalis TaxID=2941325 RepID=UPI00203C4DD6|nr:DNA internalization-related competence protein ComEC/Rec2 [Adlercreutzia murintestinalis]